ncbi:Phosphatidylglycerol--prolipoprotein diacylglyceryl transferase [uncultured Gammaproteobacteria bacterium]
MLALVFPPLDPVAVQFGPLVVRWYALAYLAGFLGGWRYCLWLAKTNRAAPHPLDYDDFLTWAVLGVILGGRIGYVFFYQGDYYWRHPDEALMVWHGGMSFHGGLVGVVAAILLFAHRRGFSPFAFGDLIACAAPIGLFFGRLANFVNGELYGRVSDVDWAVVFPRGGPLPRHPSQLYEAALEGLVLFVVLAVLARKSTLRHRPGALCGVFWIGYGLSRIAVEFFREPDAQLGFLFAGATMGQLLSLPMVLIGVWFLAQSRAGQPEGTT